MGSHLKKLHKVGKSILNPPGYGPVYLFKHLSFLLLQRGHPALSSKGGVVPLVDELGVTSHQNIVIIREVLAHAEALKTIGGEVLGEGKFIEHHLVDQKGIAGHPVDAVGDGFGGDLEIPGDVAQSGTGVDLVEDVLMTEFSFGVVVDGEGLGRECFSTGFTPESGDRAEGNGVIRCDSRVPAAGRRVEIVGAFGVGAVWGYEHR